MKICIVTVYNSENCGSFLQAYALSEKIKEMGGSVVFLKRDTRGTSHYFPKMFLVAIKLVLNFRIDKAVLVVKQYFNFKNIQKYFSTISNRPDELDEIDCFVLGSDTIWNLDVKHFWKKREIYWSNCLKGRKVISYAPSMGNTIHISRKDENLVREGLNNIKALSVRDIHTQNIVEKYTSKKISIVCDPTLLHNEEKYSEIEKKCDLNDFILVYCFESLSEGSIKRITEFANKKNKKIVSFGAHLPWADICVAYDPIKFLGYYHKADYVITNTFHGTIFSVIYKKQFLSFAFGKIKITDVLERLGLEDRNVSEDDNFVDVFDSKINWETVDDKLENWRESSMQFLRSSIL